MTGAWTCAECGSPLININGGTGAVCPYLHGKIMPRVPAAVHRKGLITMIPEARALPIVARAIERQPVQATAEEEARPAGGKKAKKKAPTANAKGRPMFNTRHVYIVEGRVGFFRRITRKKQGLAPSQPGAIVAHLRLPGHPDDAGALIELVPWPYMENLVLKAGFVKAPPPARVDDELAEPESPAVAAEQKDLLAGQAEQSHAT